MLIYKILQPAEWAELQDAGESAGAPIDRADGYVHFSTASQVSGTAAKHFAGAEGLMLLAFDARDMGDALRWEVSRGGARFPHLYAPLRLADVIWARPMGWRDGAPLLPDGVE